MSALKLEPINNLLSQWDYVNNMQTFAKTKLKHPILRTSYRTTLTDKDDLSIPGSPSLPGITSLSPSSWWTKNRTETIWNLKLTIKMFGSFLRKASDINEKVPTNFKFNSKKILISNRKHPPKEAFTFLSWTQFKGN
jgi:hypothetical protein